MRITNLDEGLTGGQGEADQALTIDGDYLIANVELATAGGWTGGVHVR